MQRTSINVTALDNIVSANSLFTIAVFIGLSVTTTTTENQSSSELKSTGTCEASISVARRLLVYEIVSFSFFLFSSLVAQGFKLAINILNSKKVEDASNAEIYTIVLKLGMLGAATGSVMGCLFLMLSIINFIQIKLGLLSCGGQSVYAVVTLTILVASALLLYMSIVISAFSDAFGAS